MTRSIKIALRPQPIGIYGFPAGHLLLPESNHPNADAAMKSLLRGDLDVSLPEQWQFLRFAFEGATGAAVSALANDSSPIGQYNRFVLEPTRDAYESLSAELNGPLRCLLEATAFAHGMTEGSLCCEEVDGELKAVVLATKAAQQLELEDAFAAKSLLLEAVEASREVSPLLAAILLNQLGEVVRSLPGHPSELTLQYFRSAIELAEQTSLPLLQAQIWTNVAVTHQQQADGVRPTLLQAVQAYQQALRVGATIDDAPEMFAFIQNNLGLTYMSIPALEASDQLRMGVAVQAFREALKVYDREKSPALWASTQMNLANAYQYLPSSHPEENLMKSVEAYDEILEVRTKAMDPVGYARVQMNQANALAHLGMFKPALEKLAESYKLFQWHEQEESAATAMGLVDQIQQTMGDSTPTAAVET